MESFIASLTTMHSQWEKHRRDTKTTWEPHHTPLLHLLYEEFFFFFFSLLSVLFRGYLLKISSLCQN
jgi:hypothetical protein